MILTSFDPTRELIYLTAKLWSPRGKPQPARMVFDPSIHVHDLPDDGIDGLLGLDFLRRLDYEVRSARGEIRARPASLDA